MSSAGQKVTNDARANEAINEGVGVVTSDSLAAESLKGSGAFGAGNPKAAASQQPSSSTTTNTTDTSSATKLDPAIDAEAREAQQGWTESSELQGGARLASATGGIPGTRSTGGTGVPQERPSGANVSEGGFDSNAPNASFSTDIGGKDDPGRQAELDMQRRQAATVGGGPKQRELDTNTPYDALKSEERA